MGVQISLQDSDFIFFAHIHISEIAESYDSSFFFFLIYLFLVALSPRCCARAFSSCSQEGLLFVAVHRLLLAVTSLAAEHRL